MPVDPVTNIDSTPAEAPTGSRPRELPVTRSLTLVFASSLIIALLAAVASEAGLLYGATLYRSEGLLLQKLPTDLFTLVVGLPLLLGSMWQAWRGKLLGLLCWPGLLLYLLYIYVAYAIGVPFNVMFVAYVLLVALSAYTTIGLVASIDAEAVRRRLAGTVPTRLAGGILTVIAILFTMINLADVVTALDSPVPDHLLLVPVWISDCTVLAPALLVGGLLLWKRRALGYVSGAGLLLVGSMLFAGAIVALAFPAFQAVSPIDVSGTAFMLVASLICTVPLGLYVRAVVKSEHSSQPEGDPGQGSRRVFGTERE